MGLRWEFCAAQSGSSTANWENHSFMELAQAPTVVLNQEKGLCQTAEKHTCIQIYFIKMKGAWLKPWKTWCSHLTPTADLWLTSPSILIVNLYYITLIAKHHVGGLQGKPPAPHHLSFHPLLINYVYMTWTMSICQNTAHILHSSSMMYKKN